MFLHCKPLVWYYMFFFFFFPSSIINEELSNNFFFSRILLCSMVYVWIPLAQVLSFTPSIMMVFSVYQHFQSVQIFSSTTVSSLGLLKSRVFVFCIFHISMHYPLPPTHTNRWPIIINKIIDLHFGIVPYNVITYSFIYILSFSRPKLLQVQKSRKLAVNCPSLYLFISLIFGYDRLIPLYWSRRQSVASQGKNVGKA